MRATDSQRDQAQPGQDGTRLQAQADLAKGPDWSQWWPFERATGEALKQLNRKQKQQFDDYEEALM